MCKRHKKRFKEKQPAEKSFWLAIISSFGIIALLSTLAMLVLLIITMFNLISYFTKINFGLLVNPEIVFIVGVLIDPLQFLSSALGLGAVYYGIKALIQKTEKKVQATIGIILGFLVVVYNLFYAIIYPLLN